MAYYETMYIIHPDASQEDVTALNDKLKGILTKNKAKIINFEDWGKKKLAYKVNKQVKGHYSLINYEGPPKAIFELERIMKVTENIMKFLSVKMKKDEVNRLNKRLTAKDKAEREAEKAVEQEQKSEEPKTAEE